MMKYHRYPGVVFRPDTFGAARVYLWLMKLFFLKDFLKRRQYAARLPKDGGWQHIDESKAFITFHAGDEDVVARAVESALAFALPDNMKTLEKRPKKPFLLQQRLDYDDPQTWPIFFLACHPILLHPVTEYLGMLPVLQNATFLYSPNETRTPARSQLFHLDGEEYKQVKVFIHLDDVDEDTGPLTIIDGCNSRQLYKALKKSGLTRFRNEKHEDETVFRFVDENAIHKLCGPRGTMSLVDTCNCYHYGSRYGKRPRLALLLHYTTPYSVNTPIYGRKYVKPEIIEQMPKADEELCKLVLGLETFYTVLPGRAR